MELFDIPLLSREQIANLSPAELGQRQSEVLEALPMVSPMLSAPDEMHSWVTMPLRMFVDYTESLWAETPAPGAVRQFLEEYRRGLPK